MLQEGVGPVPFLGTEDHEKAVQLLNYGSHLGLQNVKSVVLADHLGMFVIPPEVDAYMIHLRLVSEEEELEPRDWCEQLEMRQEDCADINEGLPDPCGVVHQEAAVAVGPEAVVGNES